MKKRLIFICMLMLFVAVLTDASRAQTLDAQEQIILSHIRSGRDQEANSACDELIEKFSADEEIVEAIYNINMALLRTGNYAKARQLYKVAIESWPNAKHTDDRKRALARVTIQLVKQSRADDVAMTLISDYSDNQRPSEATAYFAQASGRLGDYELARVLYERYVEQHPQDDWAVWAQMGAAVSSLGLGDKEGMDQALGKLTTDYATNPHAQKMAWPFAQFCTYLDTLRSEDEYNVETVIYKKILRDLIEPKAEVLLDHIGDIYRDRFEYEKAEELFGYVADTWRGELRAIEAQTNIVRMYISKGDEPNSNKTFDTLVEKFAADDRLAWFVEQIADRYRELGHIEKAFKKYRYVLKQWPLYERAIWCQMRIVRSRVWLGDYEEAESEFKSLIALYKNDPGLTKVVNEVLESYYRVGQDEKGRELYQFAVMNYPDTEIEIQSLKVEILASIANSDDSNAQAGLDRLLADFEGNLSLEQTLLDIGKQYYSQSYEEESRALYSEARRSFQRTIKALETVLSLPQCSTHAASECKEILGDCYRRFSDKSCGAYVVWHVLHYYGLMNSLDEIVREMEIATKGSVSVFEVVHALRTNGIAVRAVKLDLDRVTEIDKPFIRWIAPIQKERLGHFVLCIPSGSGKVIQLDGTEEPKIIDLSGFSELGQQQTRWDGTAILIEGPDSSAKNNGLGLNNEVSVSMYIISGLARRWLGYELSEHELSLQDQFLLRGGCDDCEEVGQECWSVPDCNVDGDCILFAADHVCNDDTEEENCQPGGWPNCYYDPAHWCNPKDQLSGMCDMANNFCATNGEDLGNCGTLPVHPQPKQWIRQCYDGLW